MDSLRRGCRESTENVMPTSPSPGEGWQRLPALQEGSATDVHSFRRQNSSGSYMSVERGSSRTSRPQSQSGRNPSSASPLGCRLLPRTARSTRSPSPVSDCGHQWSRANTPSPPPGGAFLTDVDVFGVSSPPSRIGTGRRPDSSASMYEIGGYSYGRPGSRQSIISIDS